MAAARTGSAVAVPEDLLIEPARLAIGRQIGVGASAIVYDATYTFHDRAQPVVFKRFNQEMLRDPRDLGAITREVNTMHEVDLDQNVLSLLGVAADPRAVDRNGAKIGIGLMLEKASEGSAYDVLRRSSPPSWAMRMGILLDTARGMLALHNHKPPILHRDLKSLNVLVCKVSLAGSEEEEEQYIAKIADFGLAQACSTTTAAKTKTKGAGSHPWMAPEVYDGKYSEGTDVWAFAMMIYEFMTRKLPYDRMSTPEIFKAVHDGKRPDMSLIEAGCPDILRDLMESCLAANPLARPSFADIVARLEAAMPRTMSSSALAKSAATVRTRGGGSVDERLAAMKKMLEQHDAAILQVRADFERETASLRLACAQCATTEQVLALLDQNTAELKTFVAKVSKTLPRPCRVEVSHRLLGTRKVVALIFQCPDTYVELKVESTSWSLWLKFTVSLVQTGFAVLEGDLGGAAQGGLEAVMNAYNVYHEKSADQKSFDVLMKEPMLLSSEHDQLLKGLREEGFFDKFEYDAQRAEWVATDRAAPTSPAEKKALKKRAKEEDQRRQREAKKEAQRRQQEQQQRQREAKEEEERRQHEAAERARKDGASVELARVEEQIKLLRERLNVAKSVPPEELDAVLLMKLKKEIEEAEGSRARIIADETAREEEKRRREEEQRRREAEELALKQQREAEELARREEAAREQVRLEAEAQAQREKEKARVKAQREEEAKRAREEAEAREQARVQKEQERQKSLAEDKAAYERDEANMQQEKDSLRAHLASAAANDELDRVAALQRQLREFPKTVEEWRAVKREAEAAILDEFFTATGGVRGFGGYLGGSWKKRKGWAKASTPAADRCGVAVDHEGYVTVVALPSNGLRGEIPASFGGLSRLQSVDLRGNVDLVAGAAALKAAGLSAKKFQRRTSLNSKPFASTIVKTMADSASDGGSVFRPASSRTRITCSLPKSMRPVFDRW